MHLLQVRYDGTTRILCVQKTSVYDDRHDLGVSLPSISRILRYRLRNDMPRTRILFSYNLIPNHISGQFHDECSLLDYYDMANSPHAHSEDVLQAVGPLAVRSRPGTRLGCPRHAARRERVV